MNEKLQKMIAEYESLLPMYDQRLKDLRGMRGHAGEVARDHVKRNKLFCLQVIEDLKSLQ